MIDILSLEGSCDPEPNGFLGEQVELVVNHNSSCNPEPNGFSGEQVKFILLWFTL